MSKDFVIISPDGLEPNIQLAVIAHAENNDVKKLTVRAQGPKTHIMTCLSMLVMELSKKLSVDDITYAVTIGLGVDKLIESISRKLMGQDEESEDGEE